MSIISAKQLTKIYGDKLKALDNIELSIHEGEWIAIMGPSGSGKSTLLNLISCLDKPTHGSLVVCGEEIGSLSRQELTQFRRDNIGLIFQQFHLIPYLSAMENVMIAQYYHSLSDKGEASQALAEVGLADRLNHLPSQLSGGEQQRVCIARALINKPKVILADEPTGNLDEVNEQIVLNLLKKLHREGHTILMVTHSPAVGNCADRQIHLEHGRISNSIIIEKKPELDERVLLKVSA